VVHRDDPLARRRLSELSIYETPTGFRLLIIDWADESQMEAELPSFDEARQRAASLVQDDNLNWEPWTPPGEDSA